MPLVGICAGGYRVTDIPRLPFSELIRAVRKHPLEGIVASTVAVNIGTDIDEYGDNIAAAWLNAVWLVRRCNS